MHPVLVRLSALGIRVSADGSQLRVAPRSAITDEVRQLVRIHKDELLTALGRRRRASKPKNHAAGVITEYRGDRPMPARRTPAPGQS